MQKRKASTYITSVLSAMPSVERIDSSNLQFKKESFYPHASFFGYRFHEAPGWGGYSVTVSLKLKNSRYGQYQVRYTEKGESIIKSLGFDFNDLSNPKVVTFGEMSMRFTGQIDEDAKTLEKSLCTLVWNREAMIFSSSSNHKSNCEKNLTIDLLEGQLRCESCGYNTVICGTCMIDRYQENGLDLCEYCWDESD